MDGVQRPNPPSVSALRRPEGGQDDVVDDGDEEGASDRIPTGVEGRTRTAGITWASRGTFRLISGDTWPRSTARCSSA